jgi:hypothetical protein
MRSIDRLVGDRTAFAAAWERQPLLSHDLGDFADVFGPGEAQRMLADGLPAATVRLFREGASLPTEHAARPKRPNAGNHVRIADYGRVARYVSEGYTLVLDEVQEYSPAVAAFAGDLAAETGYPVDCAAFLTPPHSRGAGPHTDTIGLFMRQVHGTKRWRISAPVEPWPAKRWQPGDPAEEVLDVVLEPGQCLYLPRGHVHVGETGDEASVHLALSLDTPTWGALLGAAVRVLAAEIPELREPLPPLFAAVDRERLLDERMTALAERLAKVRWSDLAPKQPRRPGPPAAAGALAAVLDTPPRQKEPTS